MIINMHPHKKSDGFSLIELMVGVVVALLTTVVIFRSYQAYEGQRRTTGAASDAISNGQFVSSFLGREIGQAGWGFQFGSGGVGCDFSSKMTATAWGNYTLLGTGGSVLSSPTGINQQVMMPVMIVDGGSASGRQTNSDVIRVMYSSSVSSVPYNGTLLAASTTFLPASVVTFNQGDLILLQNTSNNTCQISQITNANPTTGTGLQMATGTGPCIRGNSDCSGSGFNPTATLTGVNWVADLGTLTSNTYVVQGSTLWQYSGILGNSYDASHTPPGNPLTGAGYIRDASGRGQQTAISQDIVNIQAEYGLDTQGTGTSGAGVNNVNSWVTATGNFAPASLNSIASGGHPYAQQVRAIRYLVVTRSALPEKKDSAGNCNATPLTNQYPTLTWPNGGTIQIDLSLGQPAANTWNCYRYKFFMDVIPLRGIIWSVRSYE